ncbi:Carboxymuconolactone decarboxylase family protein [Aquisphaera giovannonii]|uniref:Carboxymuconolactone decarboxylase family protein n=1 Tax=Aquisphaera giovannonii TaxID=406548 RepID=A0A5B9W9X7_9BACT|nr:hypothetical protein [Aquisphaera giovannonii]QEH36895.1 Carboxymuconolactone decarboxylase family protein [Aquisphaera giovannonii]
MNWPTVSLAAALVAAAVPASRAEDVPDSTPRPVAATRPQLKEQLERSKHSRPRLPLPPPTADEIAAARNPSRPGPMGGIINNGRMRKLYLPPEVLGGGFQREPDPAMTLSNTFKTKFFWIVSRANNCAYCQGHQEVKLASDGVTEDEIAALDGDWSGFPERDRAAFAFTKKLTFEPDKVADADIDRLRAHYSDLQILEIITAVAGFNAMNRWTGALAIPQEEHRVYLTETSEPFRSLRSMVAPLPSDAPATTPTCAVPRDRGPLEDGDALKAALDRCRHRNPRLPLADEAASRALLPSDWPDSGPAPEWVRLLANFPKGGKAWIAQHFYSQTKGRLSPKLKAEIAYAAARNDRAWYALGHAIRRLQDAGLNDEAIAALGRGGDSMPEPERLVLSFSRKLTVDPALITDADVEGLRKHFSDHEVAEIVYQVTDAAFFDRLTESAGLRLER